MLATTFKSSKLLVQSIAVILSLLINSLLIYLIATKSPKKMGNYRHLMSFFCASSIFFALLDITVRPTIYAYKSSFFMTMDLREREIPLWLGRILICLMCGCFGLTIYGIAIHFIYRFFALERQGRLRYFKGYAIIFWLSIPIMGGASWFSVCYFIFTMDPVKTDFFRQIVADFAGEDISHSAYAGTLFYPPDDQGHAHYDRVAFLGLALFLTIMSIPLIIVIFVGAKSFLKIRELLNSQGNSKFTKSLQSQLYKALVAQTVIPLFLLFTPFGIIFICPVFEINCQFILAPITFIYAFYPALDPLPILYFVENYRMAISEWLQNVFCCFCCCCSKCKSNRIQNYSGGGEVEESSRSQSVY